MSDYPEHDKLAAVSRETQVIGEFLEWLQGQGIQLMVYRDDLTDYRPTDPECELPFKSDGARPCEQAHDTATATT